MTCSRRIAPFRLRAALLGLALLAGTSAFARPVAVGGVPVSPTLETQTLGAGLEGVPAAFLTRLGVTVQSGVNDLRLRIGARELRFTPRTGWQGATPGVSLPAPALVGGNVYVALPVLRELGVVVLADGPEILDLAPAPAVTAQTPPPTLPAPTPTTPAVPAPTPTAPTATPTVPVAPVSPALPARPVPSGPRLANVRSSITMKRAMEHQRVVLEFDADVRYDLARDARGLSVTVFGAGLSTPDVQKLDSGDLLTVTAGNGNVVVRLDTGKDAQSEVFTLPDPPRIVVDTVTNTDPSVTPPPDVERLPTGVAYRQIGRLHLLSFDPEQYVPKVVTAPVGQSVSLFDHVKRAGGVAGVNGGYFDPRSALPVDLVAQGGLMIASSLERRGALGITESGGVLFGFPKPRYSLTGAWGTTVVNTVTAKPNPNWLTLFVGDSRTTVGADGFTTLVLDGQTVVRAHTGPTVPASGEIAVTFDPARRPDLPRTGGVAAQLTLNWAASGWDGVREALAAGPLLVDGGRTVIDAVREGFDTRTNVWRPTRQVAFATYGGRPTIAYIETGTPEEFARALAAAGVERALRLDSGSSATVYFSGGYLNTVWSRPTPNAIVLVPKSTVGPVGIRK